jgi:uncharacterized SAM-binding protein YcdF (DUF218 family)
MIERGLPADVVLLMPQATSTHDEARICLALSEERDFSRLVVVAESYHTLRTKLTFRHVFRNADVELIYVAAHPDWFDVRTWWQSERPVLAVFQEYLKLGYYLFKGYII